MAIDYITSLLNKEEGITVAFKKAILELPSNFFETACTFLYRVGGTIPLSLNDDGSAVGVKLEKVEKISKEIANMSIGPIKLNPEFLLHPNIVSVEGKLVIQVLIPVSSQVYKTNDKYFDRSIANDLVVATHAKISELYLRNKMYL